MSLIGESDTTLESQGEPRCCESGSLRNFWGMQVKRSIFALRATTRSTAGSMHARSARRRGVVAAGVSGALVLGLLVSVPMLAGAAAGDPTPAPGDYRPNLVTSSGPAFSTTTAVVVGLPSFRVPIAEGSSTFINNRWGGADAASGRSVLLGLDGRLYEGVDREQGYDRGLRLANVADPDMRFIKLRAGNEPGHNGGARRRTRHLPGAWHRRQPVVFRPLFRRRVSRQLGGNAVSAGQPASGRDCCRH